MGRPKIVGTLGKELKQLEADIAANPDDVEARRRHAALKARLERTKAEKKAKAKEAKAETPKAPQEHANTTTKRERAALKLESS
ncbi:MAG: hypothetical protein Q9198_007705, partial [Flavoplaca austrocitrina]